MFEAIKRFFSKEIRLTLDEEIEYERKIKRAQNIPPKKVYSTTYTALPIAHSTPTTDYLVLSTVLDDHSKLSHSDSAPIHSWDSSHDYSSSSYDSSSSDYSSGGGDFGGGGSSGGWD